MVAPETPPATALQHLLDHTATLRAQGRETEALACGPDILRAYFRAEQGREHPRDNPRAFTDKLFCRMLETHERGSPTYSRLSDKLVAREWAAERIGERFITPIVWSGFDANEIPWDRLPAECLLKCAEGSGKGTRLVAPFDTQAALALAATWQGESYYWRRREFHYWDVPRRLLVEECLDDGHPDGPIDYIFFCFDGVPRLLQVGSRSHTIHRFFLPDWSPVKLTYRELYEAPEMPRPAQLDEMLDLASQLSAGFDFVRVDLYCVKEGIRFGEMTFTPRAGKLRFEPPDWDDRLGEWWRYGGLPDG